MSDRAELLQNFAQAAGELAVEALNGLTVEKRKAVNDAMQSGAAHLRVTAVLDPLIVVISMHSTVDRGIAPQVLLRAGAPGPQEGDFN